jgi:hydrogenase expression/formation protein HypC
MKITEIRPDGTAVAELDGSRHEVDLSLVPGAGVGAYVIVHAGFAIERLNEREADATLSLFRDLAAMQAEG